MDYVSTPEEKIGDIRLGGVPAAAFEVSIEKRGEVVKEVDPAAARHLIRADLLLKAQTLRELFSGSDALWKWHSNVQEEERSIGHLTQSVIDLEGRVDNRCYHDIGNAFSAAMVPPRSITEEKYLDIASVLLDIVERRLGELSGMARGIERMQWCKRFADTVKFMKGVEELKAFLLTRMGTFKTDVTLALDERLQKFLQRMEEQRHLRISVTNADQDIQREEGVINQLPGEAFLFNHYQRLERAQQHREVANEGLSKYAKEQPEAEQFLIDSVRRDARFKVLEVLRDPIVGILNEVLLHVGYALHHEPFTTPQVHEHLEKIMEQLKIQALERCIKEIELMTSHSLSKMTPGYDGLSIPSCMQDYLKRGGRAMVLRRSVKPNIYCSDGHNQQARERGYYWNFAKPYEKYEGHWVPFPTGVMEGEREVLGDIARAMVAKMTPELEKGMQAFKEQFKGCDRLSMYPTIDLTILDQRDSEKNFVSEKFIGELKERK